jgi:hypothetical protein
MTAATATNGRKPAGPKVLAYPPVMHRRPLCACEMFRGGKAGACEIEGNIYAVGYHSALPPKGEPVVLGYWFFKVGGGGELGERYDILISKHGLICECKDSQCRQRKCKHVLALEQFIESGEMV